MMARRGREADRGPDCGAEIAVRLQARARANEIVGERHGVVLARVTAPPLQGRANHALRRLIARRARVGIERVQIVRGAASREKTVRVQGLTSAQLRGALRPPGAD
jgi:uncharacterized protein (TIGR00251 family)